MRELEKDGQQKSSKRNRYTWMTKNDAKTNDLCECIKRFEDRWLYMMLLNEPSRVERGKLPTFVRVRKSPFASTAVAFFFPMHVFMMVSFCFRLPGSIRHPCNQQTHGEHFWPVCLSSFCFYVKLCFWCDSRINFKAHLNWISVGARKCSSHFFSCWFPQSNLELWFRGHAVPDDLPHLLLIFFFSFAKFIPRLACEFVECFQCAFGFFFSAQYFGRRCEPFSLKPFLQLFFVSFFHSKIYIKEWTVKRGWIEDDLLHRIDLSGFYGPDFFSRKHHKQWLCMANLKRIKLYKSSFNPLYRNSESNRWTDNKFSL